MCAAWIWHVFRECRAPYICVSTIPISKDNTQTKTYSQSALALIESDDGHEFIPAEDVAGFVENLYQSLDPSMRHASIEAGLLTVDVLSTVNIEGTLNI